jgi:hypothetical protein
MIKILMSLFAALELNDIYKNKINKIEEKITSNNKFTSINLLFIVIVFYYYKKVNYNFYNVI